MMDDEAYARFTELYIPEPMSGCWIWLGALNAGGYGRFGFKGKKYTAHRSSLERVRGEPLGSLFACHKCDNPLCVNPDHLYAGTHQDNTRDAVERGRMYRWGGERSGENNPKARLTAEIVREVRKRFTSRPFYGISKAANELGISRGHLYSILIGKEWPSVQ